VDPREQRRGAMSNYYSVEKEFHDYAEDIEGINIHYLWTPLGGTPDWENQRATRFMPIVRSSQGDTPLPAANWSLELRRLRKKLLKLPQHIPDPKHGTLMNRYLLHYYFEIFQGGHRHYTALNTEEIVTGAGKGTPTPEEPQEPHISSARVPGGVDSDRGGE
jgi:hypothetical protein